MSLGGTRHPIACELFRDPCGIGPAPFLGLHSLSLP